MPTRIDIDVDPGGAGDETSISAALSTQAAIGKDLVTRDVYLVITCRSSDGTADTSTVAITGWTTDKDHRIIIRQDPGQPHLGDWNTSYYRLQPSSGTIFDIDDDYVELDGLQVNQLDTSGSTHHLVDALNCTGTIIKNCYFLSNTGGTGNTGPTAVNFEEDTAGSYVNYIYNNIIYSRDGLYYKTNGASVITTVYIYNNGIWTSEFTATTRYGIRLEEPFGALTVFAYNNTMVNFGSFGSAGDWSTSSIGLGSVTTGTNATWDTTSPDGASYQNLLPAWEDIGNLDVNLKNTDTDMKDNGTDLYSSSPIAVTTDARAAERETGASFDIGPLEEGTDGTADVRVELYQPLNATASVQAPSVGAQVGATVSPSVVTATASVQAPTATQQTLGPVTFYNALPW